MGLRQASKRPGRAASSNPTALQDRAGDGRADSCQVKSRGGRRGGPTRLTRWRRNVEQESEWVRNGCCANRRNQGADRSSHRRRLVGGVVPLPAADLGSLTATQGRPCAAAQRRSSRRRPVLHPQRIRADVELSRSDGNALLGARHPALPLAAAVPGVAGVPGDHAPRRRVDHLHAARRRHTVGGRREAHRDQLCAPAVHGAALVRTVLRRHQLGRAGVVDQRGMAGLPAVRRDHPGDLPDGARDPGPHADLPGLRCCTAAHSAAAGQRPFLHPPWSWLPRIVAQFVAGALACAAVRRLQIGRRGQHISALPRYC